MKKFIIKVAILAVIIFGLDICVGMVCKFLQYHAKGGDTGKMMYIADKMNEDILVFGSSRGLRHYNPQILEDSLGMSCYNCGRDGNGIIFSYGQYRLFSNRYTPKVIIYDIVESFDMIDYHHNEIYLEWLRYFYDRDGIDSIFWSVDKNERWKMMSNMRIYNEKFIQLASDFYNPMKSDIKGFRPYPQTMNYEPATNKTDKKPVIKYSSLKMYYFKRLIKDCKRNGTTLIFAVSPLYHSETTKVFDPIIALAKQENIPFLNHYYDSDICNDKQYFKDTSHLNYKGADVYTKKIIKELRKYIKTSY